MNNEIKVSLSVVLQGRTMLSQEAAKALEEQGLAGYDEFNMEVSDAKGQNREEIHFHFYHLCHARLIHIFVPQIRSFRKVMKRQ